MLADTTLYSMASTEVSADDGSQPSNKVKVKDPHAKKFKGEDGQIIYVEGEEDTPNDLIYWLLLLAVIAAWIGASILACCMLCCQGEKITYKEQLEREMMMEQSEVGNNEGGEDERNLLSS